MSTELSHHSDYQHLLGRISTVYSAGQLRAHQAVNVAITSTYWQIGRDIVEFEQGGKVRADYGKALLTSLASDLTLRHGKGFSRSNLVYMRLLYLHYSKGQKPSDLLSWSRGATSQKAGFNPSFIYGELATIKNQADVKSYNIGAEFVTAQIGE